MTDNKRKYADQGELNTKKTLIRIGAMTVLAAMIGGGLYYLTNKKVKENLAENPKSTQVLEFKNSTPDELAQSIFQAIKHNDVELYMKSFPDSDELKRYIKNNTDDNKIVSSDYIKGRRWNSNKSFMATINKIHQEGGDLSSVKLVSFEQGINKKNELEYVSIFMALKCGQHYFELRIESCLQINSKWYIHNGIDGIRSF